MSLLAQYNLLKFETLYSDPQSNVLYGSIHQLSIKVRLYLYEGIKTTSLWWCRLADYHRSLYCASFRASAYPAYYRGNATHGVDVSVATICPLEFIKLTLCVIYTLSNTILKQFTDSLNKRKLSCQLTVQIRHPKRNFASFL